MGGIFGIKTLFPSANHILSFLGFLHSPTPSLHSSRAAGTLRVSLCFPPIPFLVHPPFATLLPYTLAYGSYLTFVFTNHLVSLNTWHPVATDFPPVLRDHPRSQAQQRALKHHLISHLRSFVPLCGFGRIVFLFNSFLPDPRSVAFKVTWTWTVLSRLKSHSFLSGIENGNDTMNVPPIVTPPSAMSHKPCLQTPVSYK